MNLEGEICYSWGEKKWPLLGLSVSGTCFLTTATSPAGRESGCRCPRVTAQPREPLRPLIKQTEVPAAASSSTRVSEPSGQARLLDPDSNKSPTQTLNFTFELPPQ